MFLFKHSKIPGTAVSNYLNNLRTAWGNFNAHIIASRRRSINVIKVFHDTRIPAFWTLFGKKIYKQATLFSKPAFIIVPTHSRAHYEPCHLNRLK